MVAPLLPEYRYLLDPTQHAESQDNAPNRIAMFSISGGSLQGPRECKCASCEYSERYRDLPVCGACDGLLAVILTAATAYEPGRVGFHVVRYAEPAAGLVYKTKGLRLVHAEHYTLAQIFGSEEAAVTFCRAVYMPVHTGAEEAELTLANVTEEHAHPTSLLS